MKAVLTLEENVIHAYDIQTNRIKKYIPDLIQAGLVEKVKEEQSWKKIKKYYIYQIQQ